MKKKNEKKSLTAKERKQLRQEKLEPAAQSTAEFSDAPESEVNAEAAPEKAMILGLSKKSFFLIFAAVLLAAVLIVMAIILPLFIEPYGKYDNPVAVIKLSNGMELEFEIYEKKCPVAATNFIYLAKKKYFDGALIYDMQREFIRFGGFRNENYDHRDRDLTFLDTLTDIAIPVKNEKTSTKLGYRLVKDNDAVASKGKSQGYLSYIQNHSSGEFQMCTADGAQLTVSNGNGSAEFEAIAFARYLSEDTLKNIIKLYADNYESAKPVTGKKYYMLPQEQIKIRTLKVYNLDREKWDKFNYNDYLSDTNFCSYWTSRAFLT